MSVTARKRLDALSSNASLLTSKDVAEVLNISPRTVCLWAECGELPALKIGKQWRFSTKELKTWLHNRNPGLCI